jgi:nicotinamidase-related amidase
MATGPLRSLGSSTLHVVVDMQRVFAEATEWRIPALAEVIEPILALARAHPRDIVFTRFMTPPTVESASGDWQRFYARWPSVVRDRMEPAMFDLMEPFTSLVPPAEVCDKTTFSAFASADFVTSLARRGTQTLILSGVETEVCVLATALDAVDRGLHIVLAADALTSGSPAGHRAALEAIYPRFDQQIEIAAVAEIMTTWVAA